MRLLMLGGGHAHLFVLRALAQRRVPGLEVMLVTPAERQLYSGMLPGWIAGHYTLDELTIPLRPLAQAAGVVLLPHRVAEIYPEIRRVRTEQGITLEYDLLSIGTGSDIATHGIAGAQQWTLPLRPIEQFVTRWAGLAPRIAEADRPRVSLVGAGAGGVEVALAVAQVMRAAGNGTQVQLVTGGALLPGHGEAARTRIRAELGRAQIRVLESLAVRIDSEHVDLADGGSLPSDVTLLTAGAAPPPWLAPSGLALDDQGFLAVDAHLRSTSHANVFGAGDVASIVGQPRARSGVYAVRAGPPLAENLIRRALDRPLRRYTPQRVALYLLAAGRQHAIASWNGLAWQGDWVWRWKDRIDRAFIAGFRRN
jgi:pyridine nucleotide-disulfide oxidoreductase family protein